MPTGTISYRIASETAGIDVDGVRYRATRSSRIPEAGAEGAPTGLTGPWTLWHDDGDGGSHSVGYCDAFEQLEEALEAAGRHAVDCRRRGSVPGPRPNTGPADT